MLHMFSIESVWDICLKCPVDTLDREEGLNGKHKFGSFQDLGRKPVIFYVPVWIGKAVVLFASLDLYFLSSVYSNLLQQP